MEGEGALMMVCAGRGGQGSKGGDGRRRQVRARGKGAGASAAVVSSREDAVRGETVWGPLEEGRCALLALEGSEEKLPLPQGKGLQQHQPFHRKMMQRRDQRE